MKIETVTLKLTSTIAIGGQVIKPPSLVEVTRSEAKNLLRRGKAILATIEDVEAIEVDGTPMAKSNTKEPPLHPDIALFQQDRDEQAGEGAEAETHIVAAEAADVAAPDAKPAEKKQAKRSGRRNQGAK